jgi:hypothetical protein
MNDILVDKYITFKGQVGNYPCSTDPAKLVGIITGVKRDSTNYLKSVSIKILNFDEFDRDLSYTFIEDGYMGWNYLIPISKEEAERILGVEKFFSADEEQIILDQDK